jgi:hypothetical protein
MKIYLDLFFISDILNIGKKQGNKLEKLKIYTNLENTGNTRRAL